MRLTATIETSNAAFEPDPNQETARILRKLAAMLAGGGIRGASLENVDGHKLRDFNGNTVGQVEVEQDEQPAQIIETGTVLFARSACDYDCKFLCEIISRTKKTAQVSVDGQAPKKCKIRTGPDGEEFIMPMGNHSFAPAFHASNLEAGE
mgnify:CR=1 FL=1